MTPLQDTDQKSHFKEERTWPQILAILIGALASFTDSVLFAWTSPFIVKLVQDKQNYNISENEASNLTIIQPIVLAVSCLFLSKLCDVIGRKKVLVLLSIPQILCLLISAYARSINVFYLAKVFAGIASGALWSSMPMYIGEVASPNVRGVWGNAFGSAIYIGQFAINSVGSYCDIPTTSYIFLPVPIIFFISFSFMPDTPYYYLMKKDYESAKQSLRFLTRKENVDVEFSHLKNDVDRQMSESGSWKNLISIESNRRAFIAALVLRLGQQFSGASVFTNYTQFIIQKAGGNVTPQVASMIFTAIGIPLNILVIVILVDRFSRKSLFTTSLALCSAVLLIMSLYLYLDDLPTINMSSFYWLPITLLIFYQFALSSGSSVIPSLMLSELFSVSIKTKAMTIMVIVMGISISSANGIFYLLTNAFGNFAPFLFLGISAIVFAILSLYLVPETKGKTLEEIQLSMKHR